MSLTVFPPLFLIQSLTIIFLTEPSAFASTYTVSSFEGFFCSVVSAACDEAAEVFSVSSVLFAMPNAAAVTLVPAITPAAATAITLIKSFFPVFI